MEIFGWIMSPGACVIARALITDFSSPRRLAPRLSIPPPLPWPVHPKDPAIMYYRFRPFTYEDAAVRHGGIFKPLVDQTKPPDAVVQGKIDLGPAMTFAIPLDLPLTERIGFLLILLRLPFADLGGGLRGVGGLN